MGIFNNEIIIDYDNPFANDILDREAEAKALTELFNIVENQMVLAVSSPWGTGKSAFLKMWNQYLIKEGYKTIFFNSWENDFVDEPFIAFLNEIRECLELNENDNIIKSGKLIWESILIQSPKLVSKIVKNKTGIDAEDIFSTDYLSSLIAGKIESYKVDKESISSFKNDLKQIAQNNYDVLKKPLVIFVDELDRCRPDYAIKLLERIKHLFNVDKIVFVLGIDKEALSNSIKTIYGEKTDTNGYLTRFIDLEFRLKNSPRVLYINHLINKYLNNKNNDSNAINKNKYFKECIKTLLVNFNISYREMEKVIIELYIMIKLNKVSDKDIYFIVILSLIKRMDNSLYNKIKSKDIIYNDVEKELRKVCVLPEWIDKINSSWDYIKAYLLLIINDKNEIARMNNSNNKAKDNRCLTIYNNILKKYYLNDSEGISEILIYIYGVIEMHEYSFEFR